MNPIEGGARPPSAAREVVLAAAGASARMGAWKPLLPFGGATLIEASLQAVRLAGLQAIVVTGYRGEELECLLEGRAGVRTVRNARWEGGLAGSLAVGLEAASGELIYLMHADLPLAGALPYAILAREGERRAALGLSERPLAAAFRGRLGHPILVRRRLALDLASGSGGSRLREAFLAAGMLGVETEEPGTLTDVDTQEDYERLLRDERSFRACPPPDPVLPSSNAP